MFKKAFFLSLAAFLSLAITAPSWAACDPRLVAVLPVTMRNLRPTVPVKVNGQDTTFFIDTGAFFSTISPGSAARFGMRLRPLPPGIAVAGAGGAANVSLTTANKFTLADADLSRIDFLVSEKGFESDQTGLLGENILGLFDVEFDLANGFVRLFDPKGCGKASMAYWTQAYSVIPIENRSELSRVAMGWVTINGVRTHVVFDTGAPRSMLSTQAAARAGVRPTDPGVQMRRYTAGIGLRSYMETWIAPFEDFKIGDEEIKHTKLMFGDLNMTDGDMLLGADFFISHRVFISNSQRKLYFSYNGGSVFNLEAQPTTVTEPAGPASGAPAAAVEKFSDTPTDAPGFALRAAAFADRRQFASAISDLTHAIALAPTEPKYLYERARAEEYAGDDHAVEVDLDQALKLKPDDPKAFMMRAGLLMREKRKELAEADLKAADHVLAPGASERLVLAQAYQSLSMDEAALAQYDAWIAAHPKDDDLSMAMNNRCWLRALAGKDLDQALADCNAALKLMPANPDILDSRGLVRLRRGDFAGAIGDYRGALRMQPDNAWSLYGRGIAELRVGRTAEGEADIKAAEARSPTVVEEAKAHGVTP